MTNCLLAGRYFHEFIAPISRELTQQHLQLTLAGEETQFEVRAIRTDGTTGDVEAQTSPLWKDGNVSGVLVFLRDVTERKRAQELMMQSDKLRAVGELAAGVAHNLNNSLTVIQGRAQLLLMRGMDEPTSKSLRVITNAVEEGAKALRRILEFAHREAWDCRLRMESSRAMPGRSWWSATPGKARALRCVCRSVKTIRDS